MIVAWAGLAGAAPVIGGALGLETTLDDPFLVARGARTSLLFRPADALTVELAAGWYPTPLRGDTYLLQRMVDEFLITADLSSVRSRLLGAVSVAPLAVSFGTARTSLGMSVGFGAVHTREDLEAMYAEEDPLALATERQWHPTLGSGGFVEATWKGVGLRFRLESHLYLEVVQATTLESRQLLWLGADFVYLRPMGRKR